MKRIKVLFTSHLLTLMFLESLEKRGEESLEKRELKRVWRSEGGGAWMSKEGLPSTRAKEVSANPKLPHFFVIVFCIFSPPSPTLSHFFFLLIYLQVAHHLYSYSKMVFFWLVCIILLFVFMMARGSRNRREEEEENSSPHMSDIMYDEEEGFEEEGDELDENIETLEGKAALTPLWNYVTKLEGG